MRLCLGTVQFGMDYGVQGAHKPEYAKVDKILDYAICHGITTLDCAAAYGEAEKVVGRYLKSNPGQTKNAKVVSKLSATVLDVNERACWPELAVSNAEKSRQDIGVDRLESYLFHNASLINDPYAVKALTEVKIQGISKKVGVSIYTPNEAMKALEYDDIEVIQIPYNVFDHRLDHCGFFRAARDKNVDVYARSTLLQGLLVMGEETIPSNMSFSRAYIRKYHQICRKYCISPLRAAIGYVSRHPGIDYIVFGVDSLVQLKEYVSMQEVAIPSEMADEILAVFNGVEERLVNPVMWR